MCVTAYGLGVEYLTNKQWMCSHEAGGLDCQTVGDNQWFQNDTHLA